MNKPEFISNLMQHIIITGKKFGRSAAVRCRSRESGEAEAADVPVPQRRKGQPRLLRPSRHARISAAALPLYPPAARPGKWRSAVPVLLAALLLCGSIGVPGKVSAGVAFSGASSGDASAADSAGAPSAQSGRASDDELSAADEQVESWLLKWRDPALAKPLPGTAVIRRLNGRPGTAIDVVHPANPDMDKAQWLQMLRERQEVEYVQPNSRVTLLAQPASNDPELPKQQYLDQIGAKEAWKTVHDQTGITIALVDTGMDLDHPDLKDNIVAGTNLVQPGQPPEDDNGHGTEVAGVLAGEGNNKLGVAGILWHAKLMPVKALDEEGFGDEERLGEGIMYAVNHNARIVVLSVGLYRYSPYLLDIVQYAESKGVLLVAASGNDGQLWGAKARVKYPAAYPTVLAVAGATPDNKPENRSNQGPEIDLVAPWNVYTTAVGGGYKKEEGTSMAAPQAAAAAALVWAVHPEYKPYQVRAMLRQSARDIGQPGVDNASGYGLLQIGKAVKQTLESDPYENNNSQDSAKTFPPGTRIAAQLAGGTDQDWYSLDAPFDGVMTVQFQGVVPAGQSVQPVNLTAYAGGQLQSKKETKLGSQTLEWKVKKGRNYIALQYANKQSSAILTYFLTSTFRSGPDAYENNDKPSQAFALIPKTQTITGTFHQTGDRDWYIIRFETGGTLQMSLTTDTVRIDPALAVQRADGPLLEIDDNGEGESELSQVMNITPGTYYFRVYNAMSETAGPTAGSYKLSFDFRTRYTDPNEPNDKSYEATVVRPGADYAAVIGTKSDNDWYQFRLSERSYVQLTISGVPEGIAMQAAAYDRKQTKVLAMKSDAAGNMSGAKVLDAGVYYIRVTASAPFDKQYYRLRVDAKPMAGSFTDMSGHWAEMAVAELEERQIIGGTGGHRFEPDRGITRAEAVAMLVKAYSPKGGSSVRFSDVPAGYWAYETISKATAAGWIGGYPDGSFKPGRLVTREEMAAMLTRVLALKLPKPSAAPFADIAPDRWSASGIAALKKSKVIGGYPDLTFHPQETATRAEFASALLRAIETGS